MLIDTHCHIHESDYRLPLEDVLARAAEAEVGKMILVGTSEQSSADAIKLATQYDQLYASVGVHPHDTKDGYSRIAELANEGTSASRELQGEGRISEFTSEIQAEGLNPPKIIAVGEVGLDYFYDHSPRDVQIKALETQLQVAIDNDLPVIFHVRDASSAERRHSVFNDFWAILDNFKSVRGVLHSFTDTQANVDKAFTRGLYVGINGISTFTKDAAQQKMYAAIPLDKMLLETDAPFLTPIPHRGTINEPAFLSEVAKFHATIRPNE
jgi:TatD DNase family protein